MFALVLKIYYTAGYGDALRVGTNTILAPYINDVLYSTFLNTKASSYSCFLAAWTSFRVMLIIFDLWRALIYARAWFRCSLVSIASCKVIFAISPSLSSVLKKSVMFFTKSEEPYFWKSAALIKMLDLNSLIEFSLLLIKSFIFFL